MEKIIFTTFRIAALLALSGCVYLTKPETGIKLGTLNGGQCFFDQDDIMMVEVKGEYSSIVKGTRNDRIEIMGHNSIVQRSDCWEKQNGSD